MLVGYCRVSTAEQNMELQEDALKHAGCGRIFSDVASGALDSRKGLAQAVEFCRSGDTLVAWKLDRVGRSIRHLIDVMNHLNGRGIEFKSLQEALDTRTPSGKLLFHVMAALAEFERELIRERTRAGIEAARARGRVGGRPPKISLEQLGMAKSLLSSGKAGAPEICRMLQVSKATLYRHLENKKFEVSSPAVGGEETAGTDHIGSRKN